MRGSPLPDRHAASRYRIFPSMPRSTSSGFPHRPNGAVAMADTSYPIPTTASSAEVLRRIGAPMKRIAMCLPILRVTNLHAVKPACCELACHAISPCRPDPRAHAQAALRADAHAAAASRQRHRRVRRQAPGGPRSPSRAAGRARQVQAARVHPLGRHRRERQVPQDSVDHVVLPDDRDR